MTMEPEDSRRFLIVRNDEELMAIPMEVDGEEVTCYLVDDEAEDAAFPNATRAALAAIGSCSDLDWETWAEELDRIRHQSTPTPPIEP